MDEEIGVAEEVDEDVVFAGEVSRKSIFEKRVKDKSVKDKCVKDKCVKVDLMNRNRE